MKILMINSVCGIKSTGRICTDIADELMKVGHTVRIAYGRDTIPEKYKDIAYKISSNKNIKFNVLMHRIFGNEGFRAISDTKKFIKWIKTYDPDVIHIHNLHGYYINIKYLFDYIKSAKKKVIWTLHDCWAYTGNCSHYTANKCYKWMHECKKCKYTNVYPKSYFDYTKRNFLLKKEIFNGVEDMVIVTPSIWLKKEVEKSFLNRYEIKVINNGIELDNFKPYPSDFKIKMNLENKKILLGVASVWNSNKGLLDFQKLSYLINDDYIIVLVGISKKQKKLFIDNKNVICIDRTNSVVELAKIYSASEIFINPSIEETMGLTSIEAMACGVPVIVYNKTALPEFISKNCGIVLSKNDSESIWEAIQSLHFSSEECIANAQKYSKKEMFKKYLILYGVNYD